MSRMLIVGRTRRQNAAALLEYRAYIAANPDSPLTPILEDVIVKVRAGLREQRAIERAIGWR